MSFSVFAETQTWLKNSNQNYIAKNILESTNDLAKVEAFSIQEIKKIYLADVQSKGRGRGQNSWSSPRQGASLLVTWSFECKTAPQPVAAPLFGLAVYRALVQSFSKATLSRVDLSIKAPNDIYMGAKKIAGLLTEIVMQGQKHRLIIGLGLNVFSSPTDVAVAGHLESNFEIAPTVWSKFLGQLDQEITNATEKSNASALTEPDRNDIIVALNKYVGLEKPFKSISPFGDLATETSIVSWRDL